MITLDGYLRVSGDDPDFNPEPDWLDRYYRVHGRDGAKLRVWSWDEEEDQLLLPWSAMTDLPESARVVDRRTFGRVAVQNYVSKLVPRPGQADVIEAALSMLKSKGSGLIVAPCGSGKTVIGSEVALRAGYSTCILVHKDFLAQQWEEAFRMLLPGVIIGRLKRDQCDTGITHQVVLASTQSVTNHRREYSPEFYSSFGLVIADEIHRYGAEIWQQAITKFSARLRLGLTATAYRSDGMWQVITDHFGSSVVELHGQTLIPIIYPVRTTARSHLNLGTQPWLTKTMRRAKLVTELCDNESRNEVVVRNLKKAYDAKRRVLVISERRKQLSWIADRLLYYGISDVGSYVGGMKQSVLDESATKQIILTTYQMAKEGLDIPDLDVLIMASPQAHIQQTVGRILRIREGKRTPVVVDFIDSEVPELGGLWFSRRKEYEALGYEIQGR